MVLRNTVFNCADILLTGEHRRKDFEKVNPFKLLPVIEDDGFYLPERYVFIYFYNSIHLVFLYTGVKFASQWLHGLLQTHTSCRKFATKCVLGGCVAVY